MDARTLLAARGPLTTRVATGTALIVGAVAAVWAGGLAFTALVALAALLMFAEWAVLHDLARRFRLAGLAVVAAAVAWANAGAVAEALALAVGGAVLLALFARRFDRQRMAWLAGGILYCALPAVALIALRATTDPRGFQLTVWTLAIVWATDIFAYFAGRAIGGPRLAPAISPNKTWAGLAGGVAGAAATSALLAQAFGGSVGLVRYAVVAGAGLALVAQGGDLFESWMKRQAGVKDSGWLLPGHGGVLDRLDGMAPVAMLSALGFAWLGA